MKRLVIVGATGTGKSTFARKIGQRLGLPVIELDDLYWLPGWLRQQPDVFHARVRDIADQENWIMSGNYGTIKTMVWPLADAVIWLDYSFTLTFLRLFRRSLSLALSHQPICNGNREDLTHLFSKNSIVLWLFKSFWVKRREYGISFSNPETYACPRMIRLTSPQEAKTLLETL